MITWNVIIYIHREKQNIILKSRQQLEKNEICHYLKEVLKIKEPYKTVSAAYKFFLIN